MNDLYYRPAKISQPETKHARESKKIAVKKRQLKVYAVFVYVLFILSVILLVINYFEL